jgi:hypothetical protein
MSTSELEICNRALALIKQQPVDTLSDEAEGARKFKIFYPTMRDELLCELDWSFATKIQALVVSAETVTGWEFVYAVPSDMLRIRKVFVDTGNPDPDPIDFRGPILNDAGDTKLIVAKSDAAYVEFTKAINDPALFDVLFTRAIIHRVAAAMAPAITGADRPDLGELAELWVSEAKRLHHRNTKTTPARTSTYQKAR